MREEWPDRADDKKDQPEREPTRAAHLNSINAYALGAGPILDPFLRTFGLVSVGVRDPRGNK
jgi:hypothetical protein